MEPVETAEKVVTIGELVVTLGPAVAALLALLVNTFVKNARLKRALDAGLKAWNATSNGDAAKAVDAHVKHAPTARLLRDGLAKCKPPGNGTGHG